MTMLFRLIYLLKLLKRLIKNCKKNLPIVLKNNKAEIDIDGWIKDGIIKPIDYIFFKNNEEKYAVQLSLLNTLLQENLLTPKEYEKVKCFLKQKYKVA